MALATEACCYNLFRKEPEELYPAQDSAFVNQSLETLTKIIDHLLVTRPEALFLFDPTALNNQCHLYALMTVQAVDRRFLHLSFFLSHAFATDSKLLDKLVCKTLSAMQLAAPSQEFRGFVKDSQGVRMRAARQALNRLFAEHMQTTFASGKGPLYSELSAIAHADPRLESTDGKERLYTLPKFAGVAYLIDVLAREKIPLLCKVKVITNEGTAVFTHSNHDVRALAPDAPVVVFEMVATGEGLSYLECHKIAQKCSTYSYRNASRAKRHPVEEPCLFCTPKRVDKAPYQQRFEPTLQRTDELFLALGADFVLQNQRPFLPFFSDRHNFPHLTQLFEASVPKIQECRLSMLEPLNMSVSHVYTDCAALASQETLVIEASYETHLTTRGLI